MRRLMSAIGLCVALAGPALADTVGPLDLPAWVGCDLPVLRITQDALPPEAWPGAALHEGAFAYVWRLTGDRPRPYLPPGPQMPAPVSLGGTLPFIAGALGVLTVAALTRKRRS